MASKFKKGDYIYFVDKTYPPSQEYPRKGTSWESVGRIVDNSDYITAMWLVSGITSNYYPGSIRHVYVVRMFFRYLFDSVKEFFGALKKEFLTYKGYKQFKIGDIVYLKKSTALISSCDVGKIVKKSYPQLVIEWENENIGYCCRLPEEIEHYNGIDPNKLFKSYKRHTQ